MARKPYPSGVKDDEWSYVAPYLTLMRDGAPKTRYWINPKITQSSSKAPERTDKNPEIDLSSVLSGGSGKGEGKNDGAAADEDDSDRRERQSIQDVEREEEERDKHR